MGRFVVLVSLAVALGFLASSARGQGIYYVRGDGGGSDTTKGGTGWSDAWATIQKALSSIPNSTTQSTVRVQASAGSQAYDVAARSTGGWPEHIVVNFEGGWENVDTAPTQTSVSVISDTDGTVNEPGIYLVGYNHAELKYLGFNRFRFVNVTDGIYILHTSNLDGSSIILRISNTEILANNYGIRAVYSRPGYPTWSNQFYFTNVNIRAGLSGSGDGIYINGSLDGSGMGSTGTNVCAVSSSNGVGIRLHGSVGGAVCSIEGTVVYDCSQEGLYSTNLYGSLSLAMNHCTIADCGSDGVRVLAAAGSWLKMTNSICANNAGHGVSVGSTLSLYEGYNLFYSDDAMTNGAVQALAATTLTADPVFYGHRDKPAPYYKLNYAASPCCRSASDRGNRGAYQTPGSHGTFVFLK
jgi:hypothetical protein